MSETGPVSSCVLCDRRGELRSGHVVPAFVTRWIAKTGGTGKLANLMAPGVPIQSGPTLRMFCGDCEQRLSRDERLFAENAFHPRHASDHWDGFEYGPWLIRFVEGLALRAALAHFHYRSADAEVRRGERKLERDAIPQWKSHLLNSANSSGEFEFHVILTDYVVASSETQPRTMNWYLMRGHDMTFASTKDDRSALLMVIPGFVFWIPILPRSTTGWNGTRVRQAGRYSRAQRAVVGDPGLHDLLAQRAEMIHAAEVQITPGQHAASVRRASRDPDRFLRSKSLDAHAAELSLRASGANRHNEVALTP